MPPCILRFRSNGDSSGANVPSSALNCLSDSPEPPNNPPPFPPELQGRHSLTTSPVHGSLKAHLVSVVPIVVDIEVGYCMLNSRVPSVHAGAGSGSFEGCVEGCGEDATEGSVEGCVEDATEGLDVSSIEGLFVLETVGVDVDSKYGVQSMDKPDPGSDCEGADGLLLD